MGKELQKFRRTKKNRRKLTELYEKSENVMIIHYSCESFYNRNNGKTPRITSIAIRNLSSGQTETFSIHKMAEQKGINLSDISLHYDELERLMLSEYFEYIKYHQTCYWVHWNMRDINYGFYAIEHRYKVLGEKPFKIEESKKFDIARALIAIYGVGYTGHPRLEKLVEKNKISNIGFLSGKEEAEAFENKDYVKLHQSTLRKVDVISNIFERAVDDSLKTNSSWKDVYGSIPKLIGEYLQENWIISIIGFVGGIASIVGLILFFF